MKKICNILCFLFLCFLPISVFALVKPTRDFYVNDYAKVLTEETRKYILDKSVYLSEQTNAQIVVVTVPSLNGVNIEEYATDLFRSFGIGDSKENNGLLLLLALEEREFRVEVGYGLEGILPDGKVGRLEDEYIIPFLKENEYDKGIKNGYNAFLKEICNSYELNCDVTIIQSNNEEDLTEKIFTIVLIIILINIISRLTFTKNKRHKGSLIYELLNIVTLVNRSSGGRSSYGRGHSGRGGSSGGGGASRRF